MCLTTICLKDVVYNSAMLVNFPAPVLR